MTHTGYGGKVGTGLRMIDTTCSFVRILIWNTFIAVNMKYANNRVFYLANFTLIWRSIELTVGLMHGKKEYNNNKRKTINKKKKNINNNNNPSKLIGKYF